MFARLAKHLRNNIVGYVAVFIALSAGAYAAGLKKNSVKSKQIKDGAVVSVDVGDDSLTGVDVQEPTLHGVDADRLGGSPREDFVQGAQDVGGSDLTGTYANPAIAGGAVGPADLGQLPAARMEVPTDCGILGQIVDSGTVTTIEYGNEVFDQGGLATGGCAGAGDRSRLTAPRAGTYEISSGIGWPGNPTGKRTIAILVNGTTFVAQEEYDAASTGSTLQTVSTVVRLNTGDFAQTQVVQTSGVGLIPIADGRSYMAMAWLGP
jgi:hypothetical protein